MTALIRVPSFPLAGIDAMTAATSRSFPRHTHDQYGIGVIDSGGHRSLSDKRQVEARPGNLIFVNPGEVHDGRALGGRTRSWRILYIDPAAMQAMRADILVGANTTLTFSAAVFADDNLRHCFDSAFGHANGAAVPHDPM